jgi:polar amino acid transport system ATP-binding protein
MIDVTDLRKRHDSLEVLRGVTLSIPPGEIAAIIGPSGSGKSTFLRCLNGLETFDTGRVEIDGLAIDADTESKERRRIYRLICRHVGMVFQSFNLFPHRTVLQNVVEAPIHVLGLPKDVAKERAHRLLARVGLLDKLNAMPRQLSGGQQQRVAIARALAMEPRVMLFDEPTSALDPRMTAEVLAVISDLAGDGLTMIVVTHAMSFARRVANTVHVFSEGRVVESGPPAQIFESPSQESTRALLLDVHAA